MKYQKKDRRDDERRPRKATSERSNSERTSSSRSRSSNDNSERPIRSSSPRDKFGKDERAPRARRDDSSSRLYRDNPERSSSRRSSDFNDRPKSRSNSEFGDRPKRTNSDFNDRPKRTSYKDNSDRPSRGSSSFNDKPRERRSSSDFNDRPKSRTNSDFNDRPKRGSYKENLERTNRKSSDFNDKPRERRSSSDFNDRPKRSSSDFNDKPRERRSSSDFNDRPKRSSSDFNDKPRERSSNTDFNDRPKRTSEYSDKPVERKSKSDSTDRAKRFNSEKTKRSSRTTDTDSSEKKNSKNLNTSFSKNSEDDLIRLNRYISNSGVCSRRKADELILNGEVTVNGEAVKELGYKVKVSDKIKFQGKLLKPGNLEYILLNKPKDFITTTDDPLERKTVMDLVRNASTERVYPVGRLDRNTTGLLLFTNDGDLADRLAHPRNQVRKIYEVELDKSLSTSDFEKIKEGLELEDGLAKVDAISYLDGKAKKHVGVEIHIGRNRIVRRIFESIGYEVIKLDRVVYAGLTKKDLPRGRFRHLTKEEVIYLKHLNKY